MVQAAGSHIMREWDFWGWMAYILLGLTVMMQGYATALSTTPELAAKLPAPHGYWAFTPLALFLIASLIMIIKALRRSPKIPALGAIQVLKPSLHLVWRFERIAAEEHELSILCSYDILDSANRSTLDVPPSRIGPYLQALREFDRECDDNGRLPATREAIKEALNYFVAPDGTPKSISRKEGHAQFHRVSDTFLKELNRTQGLVSIP